MRGTFGREFAECANAGSIWRTAGCVSRDTARDGNCGTTLGGSEEPIGGGTRCTIGIAIGGATRWGIGVATAGLTRCAIGGVTTEGVTGCVPDCGTVGDEIRFVIGGAAGAACGFSMKMRSRHLGHRMHAPFAPFSNASFRRYSVMQELHWTTMPMVQPAPRRKACPIIGRYFVKGKHLAMGARSR